MLIEAEAAIQDYQQLVDTAVSTVEVITVTHEGAKGYLE